MNPSRTVIFLLLALGVVAVSFSGIFIKWSSAPAGVLAMHRLWLTAVLMLPWVWRERQELVRLTGGDWVRLCASGLFLSLHFLGWMSSFHYTSVASAMIFLNLTPLFVAWGAKLVFKEKYPARAFGGMGLALIGTALVVGGDFAWGRTALWGDALSFFGALTVAVHMLLGQNLRQRVSSTVYSFVVFVIASLVLAGYNGFADVPLFAYPAKEWGIFILLAVVPTVFGHLLFNWLLKFVKAVTIQMAILGEPVGTVLLAALLLGESVTLSQVVGGLLSIGGIVWFIRAQVTAEAEGARAAA
ncbi:DMT family transporter [Laceyella putida]|uniref:DMT family transporter n=1 Tax=Laceyella putida TaxID=110101 RepID=A0ABW2RJQ6_9BACL